MNDSTERSRQRAGSDRISWGLWRRSTVEFSATANQRLTGVDVVRQHFNGSWQVGAVQRRQLIIECQQKVRIAQRIPGLSRTRIAVENGPQHIDSPLDLAAAQE